MQERLVLIPKDLSIKAFPHQVEANRTVQGGSLYGLRRKKMQWNMVEAAVYMKGMTSETHFTNSSRGSSVGNDFIQDNGVFITTLVSGTPQPQICDATTMR
jgi:hypothetical protein